MASIQAFLKRHAVPIYFALTFAISWGSVLLVIGGPGGIPATQEQLTRLLPLAIPGMLLGPSIAGLVMTGVVSGRDGYRELLARLLRWRVGAGWYAVALLTAPAVFAAVLFTLSLVSPAYIPGIVTTSDRTSFLLLGILPALVVGFFEELGWTGFAIPSLRPRYSVAATGLIVGILWGAWHILTNDLWASGTSAGGIPVVLFATLNGVAFVVGQLPAYRVLMAWVYDRTGSLLVAMLMHASLTASTFILGPLGIAGAPLLIYGLGLAVAVWIVVAAVSAASSVALPRRPLRRRVA